MAKTLKFVYVIVLFLSLFLATKNIDGRRVSYNSFFRALPVCQTAADCPEGTRGRTYKCINNKCRYPKLLKPIQ
ncbi:Nodule Cysteine-Rich (NCR) secreted peptide [Medicago truncatula]|uniref:Nodule Cysteine-Rich (NCR) secreted peptide n=1 Tax=Medicago truncatula TaxID=3880 RepID=A0A072VH59_MEDTR|nr:Nodule Cysteine-Rich (NCR) secreted peptide [Medicago truncatula]